MAEVKPLKLMDIGGGVGRIKEYEEDDYIPVDALGIGGLNNNLLINSFFVINQRSYPISSATTTAYQYTLDRWKIPTIGQNLTWQNSAGNNFNTATAPASGILQVVEGIHIDGGPHVINWDGTASCLINDVAVSKAQIFNPPKNTLLNVKFVNGTVARPKLEPGIRPTPYFSSDFSLEMVRCMRYYENGTIIGLNGLTYTANNDTRAFIPFKVRKRITPVSSVGSFYIVGFGRVSETINTLVNVTSINSNEHGIRIAQISGTHTAVGPAMSWGTANNVAYTAEAEL